MKTMKTKKEVLEMWFLGVICLTIGGFTIRYYDKYLLIAEIIFSAVIVIIYLLGAKE